MDTKIWLTVQSAICLSPVLLWRKQNIDLTTWLTIRGRGHDVRVVTMVMVDRCNICRGSDSIYVNTISRNNQLPGEFYVLYHSAAISFRTYTYKYDDALGSHKQRFFHFFYTFYDLFAKPTNYYVPRDVLSLLKRRIYNILHF